MEVRPRWFSARYGIRAVVVAAALIVGAVALEPGVYAQSASGATETAQPAGTSVPIPLASLGDLTSLDATVTIGANGSLDGKAMQGDLTVLFSSNDQSESRIDITGSLLGPVASQVGGKLVGLFRPSKVSVYTVADGSYVVVSTLTDLCVKPSDNAATAALDQLSPQSLMALLTNSDVARGTLVGLETLDGTSVDHWVINGEEFLAAAKASADPAVQAFGQSLRSASDADLYVATDTGYPVRYQGAFSGAYEPLGLDGDFTVQVDLTGVNQNQPVTLPGACAFPISR
jgi:hypothetical protein